MGIISPLLNHMIFTLLTKASTAFSNLVKIVRGFLLKEDGFYLLTEDGGRIILEPDNTEITNQDKKTGIIINESKHSVSITKQSKNTGTITPIIKH